MLRVLSDCVVQYSQGSSNWVRLLLLLLGRWPLPGHSIGLQPPRPSHALWLRLGLRFAFCGFLSAVFRSVGLLRMLFTMFFLVVALVFAVL